MNSTTYQNSAGQTIELFEGSKGFVTFNYQTEEITVHYHDGDSMHGSTSLRAALKCIR